MTTTARKRTKRTDPLEKRIQWSLIKALRTMGFFVTSFSQPHRASMTPGVPDLVAMHRGWPVSSGAPFRVKDGLLVWIECKRPGGKCSTAQLAWHSNARACGANVIVASSLDELLSGLRELGAPI